MERNAEGPLFLGLDTSAYTTSLALVNGDEEVVCDCRLPLAVQSGSLGLRQSDAVFSHLQNMPRLFRAGQSNRGGFTLRGVAAATKPRPIEGSYMPVFKVSEAFGLFLAQTMGLVYWPSSHQEGHVMAGIWSAGLEPGRYLALHLSGGTTEIIESEEHGPGKLVLKLLGGGVDLHCGQFVDRVGLALGFDFPAGPGLEKLARTSRKERISLPVAVKGREISFSGPASHAERLIGQGCDRAELARAVENCIADSLAKAVDGLEKSPRHYRGLLAVGGVASNLHIRLRLREKLPGWRCYFAGSVYASDNAVGLAVQAARLCREGS